MPYNKGDFTQQGINGDVSALLRLNEKRVMKVVLSSDDESDNCDISGKVYDLLNGTSYDIGSGVSGNIEITENGENINVAPYATATVNVAGGGGDSDFTTAQVTIISDTIVRALEGFEVYDQGGMSGLVVYDTLNTGTYIRTVPLYKGLAVWLIPAQYTGKITVSGDIDMQDGVLLITGNGTITYVS